MRILVLCISSIRSGSTNVQRLQPNTLDLLRTWCNNNPAIANQSEFRDNHSKNFHLKIEIQNGHTVTAKVKRRDGRSTISVAL